MRRTDLRGGRSDSERRRLVSAWEQSGQSARVFGGRKGISAQCLYAWRRRFLPAGGESAPAFVEVVRGSPVLVDPGGIELTIGGASIRFAGADAARDLVTVLSAFRTC